MWAHILNSFILNRYSYDLSSILEGKTVIHLIKISYYYNISSDLRSQLNQKRVFINNASTRVISLQFLINNIRTNNLRRYQERKKVLEAEIQIEKDLIRNLLRDIKEIESRLERLLV